MRYPLKAADDQGCVESLASKHPVFTVYFIRTSSYCLYHFDFIISIFFLMCDVIFLSQKLCILKFFVHPRNLTWNPKMKVWKMFFLFTWVILRFHVTVVFRVVSFLSIILKTNSVWIIPSRAIPCRPGSGKHVTEAALVPWAY